MILDILASNNTPLQIKLHSDKAKGHFFSPASHINVILNEQINRDKIYDFFFNGKTNLTVIDAGANVGIFSIFCSPSSKIVYAIEPTPDHYEILQETTQPFPNIQTINAAVWDKNEDVKFYIVDSNTTSNSALYATNKFVNVKGKNLQTLIQEKNIDHVDLIKMDIEGSEFKVINDELLEFVYPIIDNWFLEVHPFTHYCSNYSQCKQIVIDKFTQHGYQVDHKGHDGLFIHK